MSATTTNKYKSTFIFDLRESEDSADKVLAEIKDLLDTIGGEAIEVEDIGVREFARAADQRFTQGHFGEVYFTAPGSTPAELKEKLRLEDRKSVV